MLRSASASMLRRRVALLILGATLLASCDTFPRNAGMSVTEDGVPAVVFTPCADREEVRTIRVLRSDREGSSDEDYDQVWEATVAVGSGSGAFWPILGNDPRYARVTRADVTLGDSDRYRVYVTTTEHVILTGFRRNDLVDGQVLYDGRSKAVDEYVAGNGVC